ncbi:MAG TPA: SDR family oxidoreductase, partial [Sphingorhabdus lacus]|nr:SDR family oxidoreductase [Sphingorhabdus lacus]
QTSDQHVALITGASSGIGKIMAAALVDIGYRVFGTSRNPNGTEPYSGVELVAMDVDNTESVDRAVAEVIDRADRLDVVVCNAGFGLMGPIEDTATELMIAQFQTNVFGVHRVCRAVLPHLRKREAAKIVVTGSLAGLVGAPFQGIYSASKFALEGYCEALRIELRQSPVRVALIEPGDFPTGFTSARRVLPETDVSSANRPRLARALAIIEKDERDGGDVALLSEAIVRIVQDPNPALQNLVASPEQRELIEEVKPSMSVDEWHGMLAEHYGLEEA